MKLESFLPKFFSSLVGSAREHHLSGRRPTWIAAVLAGLAFGASPLAAEQSISVFDLKDAATGSAPDPTLINGNIEWNHCRVVVVGPETDPPSPMLGEQALFVTAEENPSKKPGFGMEAKPFSPENAPAEGWLDFQLVVNKAFSLQLGAGGSPGTDVRKENPYDGVALVSFSIKTSGSGSTNVYTTVEGKKTGRKLALNVPADTPFTLRVLWTTTAETIHISFQIDGVDAHNTDSVSIPNPGSAVGIDYFLLSDVRTDSALFGPALFIGKISAGTQ